MRGRHLLPLIVIAGALVALFMFWEREELPVLPSISAPEVLSGDSLQPGPRADPPPPSTPPALNLGGRLRAHVDSLVNAGGHRSRVVFTPGNSWGVEYVLRQMKGSTRQVRADSFQVARRGGGKGVLVNPVALLPGRSDSLLVICAHIDASASRDRGWNRNWSSMPAPGADDNATGIAAMLEVLALVSNAQAKPRYTIMFVGCNAEERNPGYGGLSHRDGHHLGSRHLAAMLKREGKPVKGVIAMDMVGWNPREDYVGLFAGPRAEWLARELVAQRDYMRLDLRLPERFSGCANSDNESFDRLGIPAVLFMESCKPWRSEPHHPRNPGYHTSRDTQAFVTWSIVDKVTRLVTGYVTRASSKL